MNDGVNVGGFCLSNRVYDFLKYLTVVILPAVGALYFALAAVWGLPAAEQVLGTLAAIQVFIGATMGISSKQYEKSGAKYAGEINVDETPEKTKFSLDLKDHPDDLIGKDEVVFKVNSG